MKNAEKQATQPEEGKIQTDNVRFKWGEHNDKEGCKTINIFLEEKYIYVTDM